MLRNRKKAGIKRWCLKDVVRVLDLERRMWRKI